MLPASQEFREIDRFCLSAGAGGAARCPARLLHARPDQRRHYPQRVLVGRRLDDARPGQDLDVVVGEVAPGALLSASAVRRCGGALPEVRTSQPGHGPIRGVVRAELLM